MAGFTEHDVQRLAGLARLHLAEDEAALFTRQLSDILAFVHQIQSVDTSSLDQIEAQPDHPAALRHDVVVPSLPREDILESAPEAAAGLFKVPRVLNG